MGRDAAGNQGFSLLAKRHTSEQKKHLTEIGVWTGVARRRIQNIMDAQRHVRGSSASGFGGADERWPLSIVQRGNGGPKKHWIRLRGFAGILLTVELSIPSGVDVASHQGARRRPGPRMHVRHLMHTRSVRISATVPRGTHFEVGPALPVFPFGPKEPPRSPLEDANMPPMRPRMP